MRRMYQTPLSARTSADRSISVASRIAVHCGDQNTYTARAVILSPGSHYCKLGMEPNTKFLKGFVELTKHGFIVADGVNAAMQLKQYFRDPHWWTTPVTDMIQYSEWQKTPLVSTL
jgi:hypothetical protein